MSRSPSRDPALDPAWRLLWAVTGLAAWAWLAAMSQVWLDTPWGQRADAALTSPLVHGPPWEVRELLSWLARPVLVVAAGAVAAVLVVLALRARRVRAALSALLVPPLSLVALDRVNEGWAGLGTPSFPSGHAVAGYAVLVSVACVWPGSTPDRTPERARRALTGRWWGPALWGLALLIVTVGNVTLHAHRPGDVLAAALLVTGVAGVTLGILAPRQVRGGWGARRGTMGPP